MKILVFNWSDIKNPDSGGAEILTHEMAKRWVRAGNSVTQFCSKFSNGKEEEIIDGVRIIRQGSPIIRDPHVPVHLAAYFWYQRFGKGKFDVIVDEIHGIPFFTPLYVKEKKVALICEVANELWDVTFPFPFNVIGKSIERKYFHHYKNVPFLTISSSTRSDLIRMGVLAGKITVLPMGLTVPRYVRRFPKEKKTTCIFVGRISKTKGIEDCVEAIKIISQRIQGIQLWIVGQGDDAYLRKLKLKIRKLSLQNVIKFYGFVSQAKKFELMSRAHIILVSSVKEGWGLIVPEAGIVGTPAVAYNVSGLRDIITNGINGVLSDANPHAMSGKVVEIFENEKLYKKITEGALIRAKSFHWDETARGAFNVLQKI